MVAPDVRSLVLILAASTVAAILARLHHRLLLPTVVVEIVLGIIIGPEALGFADSDPYIEFLSNLGLVFLFFFAGLEVVEKRVPRRALGLGTAGWAMSLAIGLAAGTILEKSGVDAEGWILGVALATTALGTLVPILSDAGLLETPLGTAVLGNGVAGEFWPIVVISVFLTGVYGSVAEVLLLVGFGVLVAACWVDGASRTPAVGRPRAAGDRAHHRAGGGPALDPHPRRARAPRAGRRLRLRPGCVRRGARRRARPRYTRRRGRPHAPRGDRLRLPDPDLLRHHGLDFDVDSLLTAKGLGLAALFLALLFVIRGSASLLWRPALDRPRTLALALFVATGLPLIVAIVDIGTDRGAIDADVGASLIGAGMISVLVYPFVATRLSGADSSAAHTPSPAADVSEY